MKVQELIDQLEDWKRNEGNLEVFVEDLSCINSNCGIIRLLSVDGAHLTLIGEDEDEEAHIGISTFKLIDSHSWSEKPTLEKME